MADKLRVGVLGLSHDHVWSNLQTLVARDDAELVGAFDSREELRQKFRGEFEVEASTDSDSLLNDGVSDQALFKRHGNATQNQRSTFFKPVAVVSVSDSQRRESHPDGNCC
jgi:hypothetical protein